MEDWSDTNRACKTLWTTLFSMHQLTTDFQDSGSIPMSELAYFNPLDSDELRKKNAAMIADQLDNTFRFGRGARFEADVDRTKAFTGILNVLMDAGKPLSDLAILVDSMYIFFGEASV